MVTNNKGVHVATPPRSGQIHHIEPTKEDRAQYAKQYREEKKHQLKIKNERFDAINKRRKNKGTGRSGGGINIEVDSND